MEENENTFKSISTPKSKSNSFTKSIILPFISGIIGTSLVIGTCFGIPKLREKILGDTNPKTEISNTTLKLNTSNPGQINLEAISLKGYSETAMGVADKVLPSIVGIEIEYKVNSFFGSSTGSATGSGIIISEDRIYFNK